MSTVILDSSAILAVIQKEAGAEKVEPTLPTAIMSSVNIAEAVRVLCRTFSPNEATSMLSMLIGDVIPFDKAQAHRSGALEKIARPLGLSLGDCVCLSLGKDKAIPILTADTAWTKAASSLGIDVQLIR